jgi:hypothetical protein
MGGYYAPEGWIYFHGKAAASQGPASFPLFMNENQKTSSAADPGLRKMLKWVIIALVLTLALATVVVEITLRWFGQE